MSKLLCQGTIRIKTIGPKHIFTCIDCKSYRSMLPRWAFQTGSVTDKCGDVHQWALRPSKTPRQPAPSCSHRCTGGNGCPTVRNAAAQASGAARASLPADTACRPAARIQPKAVSPDDEAGLTTDIRSRMSSCSVLLNACVI